MSTYDVEIDKVIRKTKSRCGDKMLREALLTALSSPDLVRARQTTSGIILVGPHGTTSTHYTLSDPRSYKNVLARLRSIGLYPKR